MKSLHKVLDIIDAVAQAGSLGIGEISARLGFPPSTTHRIVATLMNRDYFKQDPEDKRYALSVKFLELASMVRLQFNLIAIARPHMEALVSEVKESVNLAVQDEDSVVYLDHVRSQHSMLQLFTRPGARVPLYCTGVGKLFLSRWGEREIDRYLERTERIQHTPRTLVSRKSIMAELERIRQQGYAVDNEEMEEGVRCVAGLILDHPRQAVGAVSISGASMRITTEKIEYFGKAVREHAMSISRELGFRER